MSTAHRWLLGIAGVLWLIVGAFFFIQPLTTALFAGAATVVIAGVALLVIGILEIVAFFAMPKGGERGWTLASGIVSVLLSIFIFWQPLYSIISIPYVLAFVLIFRGVTEIAGSFTAQKAGFKNWWIVLISGILAILLAFFIFAAPIETTIIYFGIFFIAYGIMEIAGAFVAKEPEELVA